MRNQSGKSRKRKSEINFVDAYSGASELAPPPASRDALAVPTKLRKIMQLKSLIAGGQVAKKYSAGGNPKGTVGKGPKVTSYENHLGHNTGVPDQSAGKGKGSFASKWRKGEEELKRLVEKMDKGVKTGISRGVGERRKSYLNEKKKKKKKKGKGKTFHADAIPDLNQYEKVEFGDIVQAPPKLSFPKKAAEVKVKEKLRGEQVVLHERLRLEAIESYRQRKEWSSRPGGQQLPVLNVADAEI